MEWVEVRGETVAEAEELALDQLGVAREDAEFETVQSPESRWLGLKRVEARVRARVRPSAPPPKTERGGRRRGRGGGGQGRQDRQGRQGRQDKGQDKGQGERGKSRSSGAKAQRDKQQAKPDGGKNAPREAAKSEKEDGRSRSRSDDRQKGSSNGSGRRGSDRDRGSGRQTREQAPMTSEERETVPIEEQKDVVTQFLQGVVEGFGFDASTSASMDDDTVVGSVDGSEVGLLIGPRGGTLRALQELARTTMQRHAEGRDTSRLVIDVGGYRERRREALVEFTRSQAARVVEGGESIAMEPMSSADRKVVHDAAAEIEGVTSSSAGEDPKRHVVLHPG